MRFSLKVLLSVALMVVLVGCVPSDPLPVDGGTVTSNPELETTPEQVETNVVPLPTSLPTETVTPTPTKVMVNVDLDCGEVFCQQDWSGWLTRPFTAEYALTIDLTYPYASTKNGTMDPHHGVEFPNVYGTPVIAAQSGSVVFAGSDELTVIGPYTSFYGNVVILLHQDLYNGHAVYTLYGHLSEIMVAEGDEVIIGQTIGAVGASGAADGPHLHFEVRLDENTYTASVNPILWFAPVTELTSGTTATLAGTLVNRYGTALDRFTLSLELLDEYGNVVQTYYPITYYPAGVNGFPGLNENFVMPDLPPGDYRLAFVYSTVLEYYFTLEPGALGFINLQMD